MNILHMDQSHLIREMMRNMILNTGNVSFEASSEEEAFQVMAKNEIHFIIMGLELADASGEEFIFELLKSKHSEIPVIVLTSTDNLEIRKKLFDLGVVDYLIKDTMTAEKLSDYIRAFEVQDEIIKKMEHRSVAVLDDNLLVNTLIKNILDLHGIKNIDTFRTAEELLESEKDYAIYILDLVLPGVSGEEVLLQLRKKAHNSVIILISSISNYKTISHILSSGADDYIMKPFDAGVFMARIKAHSRNFILREELEKANKELERAAVTDGLTQIFNHHYIVEKVNEECYRSERYGQNLSVLLFDIDNFKFVNDRFGHQIGDEVLVKLAQLMKEQIRESDCVGRYGGEEFMIILPGTSGVQAKFVGEKIRRAIEKHRFSVENLKVTISGGVAEYCKQDAACLIREADEGLYQAKKQGKNRIIHQEKLCSENEKNQMAFGCKS